MKHNISRGKPDERQMFKGMRNLESQSFRGDLGAAECEEWALQGHVKGNDRDGFDAMLHDPVGRQGSVSGTCWSPCPVTRTRCQTIQLKAQQGEASPCWSQAAVCFPLKLFSIIHLLSSSPSNPGFTRVSSHLPVAGNSPSTDSSRSSTRRVLRLARSAEAPLCLLLQREKFTQAVNQEVQFLNVGVLQHSCRH